VFPHLVVTRAWEKPKGSREVSCLLGSGSSQDFKVHTTTFQNLMRGIYERLFFVKDGNGFGRPPLPKENIYTERMSAASDLIIANCPKTNPITEREFASLYQARRRTAYNKAVDSLEHSAVCKSDGYVDTFTKVEKINFTSKPDPAPRIIQPRRKRYNVSVGVFLKPMEHILYKAVARCFGEKTIVKGMNGAEVGQLAYGKWSKFRHPVAIGMDASRFDQSVSVDALKWLHRIYVNCVASYKDRCVLRRLLKSQLVNIGYARVGGWIIRYGVEGSRMSGDMDTSSGNCLLASMLVYQYCTEKSIPFSLLNNGDDCVIICERDDVGRFCDVHEWFLDYGFNMVVEAPVYDFERIVFCQSHFIWNGRGYVQVRDPKVCTAKDSLSLVPFSSEPVMRAWLGAVGHGGLALNSGIPVLQEFYSMYLRESHGYNGSTHPSLESGTSFLAKGMESKWSEVTPKARYSFWLATGILPDEQVQLEGYYSKFSYSYNSSTPRGDMTPLSLYQ